MLLYPGCWYLSRIVCPHPFLPGCCEGETIAIHLLLDATFETSVHG